MMFHICFNSNTCENNYLVNPCFFNPKDPVLVAKSPGLCTSLKKTNTRQVRKNTATMKARLEKKIHFGDNRYEDFTMHKDIARRRRYRARSSKIKDKQGRLTYKLKSSPNFWAFNLLW